MDGSHPERTSWRLLLPRAALVGVAIGVVALTGGSLVLYDTEGLLGAATGVVATLLVSLLVGIWAGAPAGEEERLRIRWRWGGAGAALAVAGVFASYWELAGEAAGGAGALARMLALLALIAAPAYALGMLLPALLVWGEQWEMLQEEEVEGWGALGALTVGVLAGAVAGVLGVGLALTAWLGAGSILLGAAIAVLVPTVLPDAPPESRQEHLLHEVETPLGRLRVTEVVYPGERQPERRLYLNDEQESGELVRSGAPALAYIAAAESWLTRAAPRAGAYLFLGGGAYTLPRRIAEHDPAARITVVELDAEVTRIAQRYFGLRREHAIATVHGEARAFLERAPEDAVYDCVYLDVYGGHESIPYPLVTREAFSAVRRVLRPQGVVGINVIGVGAGAEALRLWAVVRTLREVFPALALYSHLGPDYPERQNFLLAASPEPGHRFPERAGIFEAWPPSEWDGVGDAPVLRDLLPAQPERGASRATAG